MSLKVAQSRNLKTIRETFNTILIINSLVRQFIWQCNKRSDHYVTSTLKQCRRHLMCPNFGCNKVLKYTKQTGWYGRLSSLGLYTNCPIYSTETPYKDLLHKQKNNEIKCFFFELQVTCNWFLINALNNANCVK